MVVEDLIKEKKKRERIFRDYIKYAKEIKEIAKEFYGDVRLFVFGSVIRGDYNFMHSDIDIAVITDRKDGIYEFKAKVAKISDVFEVHVMDERMWEFYKRFIDRWIEIK